MTSSDQCQHCHQDAADQSHVIWRCPYWTALRQHWPALEVDGLPACAQSALLVTAHMPPTVLLVWPQIQLGAAKIIQEWQKENRSIRDEQDKVEVEPWRTKQTSDGHVAEQDAYVLPPAKQVGQLRQMHWRPPCSSLQRKARGAETCPRGYSQGHVFVCS